MHSCDDVCNGMVILATWMAVRMNHPSDAVLACHYGLDVVLEPPHAGLPVEVQDAGAVGPLHILVSSPIPATTPGLGFDTQCDSRATHCWNVTQVIKLLRAPSRQVIKNPITSRPSQMMAMGTL